jgi:hypothetical protein
MFSNSILGIAFDAALEQLKHEEELVLHKYQQQQRQSNKNDNDDDDDANEKAQEVVFDNLFIQHEDDSNRNNSSFTQTQKAYLEQLMTEAMIQTLMKLNNAQHTSRKSTVANSHSSGGIAPKNNLLIRAPGIGSSYVTTRDFETSQQEIDKRFEEIDLEAKRKQINYFPLYRKDADNNWLIILKDPQILLTGNKVEDEILDESSKNNNNTLLSRLTVASNVKRSDNNTKNAGIDTNNNNNLVNSKELECDYAVLHVREIPLQNKTSIGVNSSKKQAPARRMR